MKSGTTSSVRPCNSCGARDAKVRLAKYGFDIVECRACGLVYVAQEVTREQLDDYYSRGYYEGNGHAYDDYLARAESRKHHYRVMLPALKRHLSPEAKEKTDLRVLDVGCAAGYFLEVAQEAGWQAQGVELSPYMSAYAREERGLNVLTGTLEEVDLPSGAFDIVTMWDVIEHVQDPQQVLKRAHELLKPGGLLVMATGDISGATARIYGEKWSLYAPPGHLFYFSPRTLGQLLRQAGLQTLGWESDGAFLINHVAPNPSALSKGVRALHGGRVVSAVLRRLKWGSVMTVYARKKSCE